MSDEPRKARIGSVKAKYALHPGPVTSQSDGQTHFVDAHQLARLYGVSPSECVVVAWDNGPGHEIVYRIRRERIERMGLIHLRPRSDGNYTLPATTQEQP